MLDVRKLEYVTWSKRPAGTAIKHEIAMGMRAKGLLLLCEERRKLQLLAEAEELEDDYHLALTIALALAVLRARFSDGKFIIKLIDEGHIVFWQGTQTTSSGAGQGRELQEFVAPNLFSTDRPWLETVMHRRYALGIRLSDGFPLMPSKTAAGECCRKPIHLGDFSKLLGQVLLKAGVQQTTSHAFKAATLEWARCSA